MTVRFALPDLGEGLVDAEIHQWLVAVGDEVASDQLLVEVETAKAVVQIPSPAAGIVLRLGGAEGDVLRVGAVLIELSDGSDSASDNNAPIGAGAAARHRVRAAPSTRARAVELGVDLAAIHGTGPGGRVTRDDVERAATAPDSGAEAAAAATPGAAPAPQPSSPAPASPAAAPSTRPASSSPTPSRQPDRTEPLRGPRRDIARTMTASWQQIPHITEFREVDATNLVRAHHSLRENWPAESARLTLLPLLALACLAVLRRHDIFNASVDMERETVRYHGAVHLGIATAAPHGLSVPVIRDADRMPLPALAAAIADAADTARTRRATPQQLSGATFTISNFGSYGTWLGTPLIAIPQVSIVGFGRVRDAVVAVGGQPVVRPTLPLAMSADHRLIDGDALGAFVTDLAAVIEDPILLLASGS